jgi:periplasmic divalent cation tolerance protein
MSTVMVTTTVDSAEAAARLSQAAVLARMAACGQVSSPITSTYWWEGKLATNQEWMIVFKTTQARSAALIELLRELHSYDVPEILVSPVTDGNPAYLRWVETETLPTQGA